MSKTTNSHLERQIAAQRKKKIVVAVQYTPRSRRSSTMATPWAKSTAFSAARSLPASTSTYSPLGSFVSYHAAAWDRVVRITSS